MKQSHNLILEATPALLSDLHDEPTQYCHLPVGLQTVHVEASTHFSNNPKRRASSGGQNKAI